MDRAPSRPAAQPPDGRQAGQRQSDRFVPGDLAECTHPGPWHLDAREARLDGPRYSDIRMVRHTGIARCPYHGGVVEVLAFDSWPGMCFPARAFRKIIPRADAAVTHDRHYLSGRLGS